jgi:pimeloyl-ACP methyl ester carboxylesterase
MGRKKKSTFVATDGTVLDILISRPESSPQGVILVYPCIGGTTRMYMVPHKELTTRGYIVVEYHPRAHGRSEGQMSMARSLKDLYCLLFSLDLDQYPITAVAHSAGCNALLQLNFSALRFARLFFVQPVFSFAESMRYMYVNGTDSEFLDAISRWTNDRKRLAGYLKSKEWLKPSFWYREKLRERINAISVDLNLGDFLEDFYIPGFDTTEYIYLIQEKLIFFLSDADTWFPVSGTKKVAEKFKIPVIIEEKAKDHFLQGCWSDIWDDILDRIE